MPAPPSFPQHQLWPGWFRDQQLAAEHAQELSSRLAAAVNAALLAQGWLDEHGDVTKAARRKKKRRRKRRRPVMGAGPPPPPPQQRPAPRRYLNKAGVTAALYAILASLLASLWAAAWALGWASAIAVLGVGAIEADVQALEDLIREGKARLDGIVQTRVSRIERALLAALRDGTSVDTLAQQISGILGGGASALLVTQTETTWASGWAAYHAYQLAGVRWVTWRSRRDGLVCPICAANDAQGPVGLGQKFTSGDRTPPAHPRCRCCLLPSGPPKPGPRPGGGSIQGKGPSR